MNWRFWEPIYTVKSVAQRLAAGLRDGSIVLDEPLEDETHDAERPSEHVNVTGVLPEAQCVATSGFMALLDHFHAPLSQKRHWESLHSGWANALRDQLNAGVLPPRYFAEVQIRVGNRVAVDVPTIEEPKDDSALVNGSIAVWAPPRPPYTASLQFTSTDLYEIQVFEDEQGPRLVATVELVSPANKDRASNRRQLAVKCGSYLQQGVSVIVVDVVTSRSGNLHSELLQLLEVADDASGLGASDLYATAYRTVPTATAQLHYWTERLSVGAILPTMPLWIAPELCVPLDLEKAYQVVCASSRIEPAGA
jgi:hypothetical protein